MAACQGEPAQGNATAQNNLLAAAGAIDPQVETMEDIPSLLLRNKVADEQINEALKSRGYLDVWRLEVEAHPWGCRLGLIDIDFDVTQHAALIEYCLNTVRDAYTGGSASTKRLQSTAA